MNSKLILIILLCIGTEVSAQKLRGSLFIIGGGERPPELMTAMLKTAQLGNEDYIILLPMSSREPDPAHFYFKKSLEGFTQAPVINFHFTGNNKTYTPWLDSLKRAKLIFIAGGDQGRFMKAVLNTPVYTAIHEA